MSRTFDIGQAVRVTTGAFANSTGVVASVNGDTFEVNIEIFGRSTPVVVTADAMEPINAVVGVTRETQHEGNRKQIETDVRNLGRFLEAVFWGERAALPLEDPLDDWQRFEVFSGELTETLAQHRAERLANYEARFATMSEDASEAPFRADRAAWRERVMPSPSADMNRRRTRRAVAELASANPDDASRATRIAVARILTDWDQLDAMNRFPINRDGPFAPSDENVQLRVYRDARSDHRVVFEMYGHHAGADNDTEEHSVIVIRPGSVWTSHDIGQTTVAEPAHGQRFESWLADPPRELAFGDGPWALLFTDRGAPVLAHLDHASQVPPSESAYYQRLATMLVSESSRVER